MCLTQYNTPTVLDSRKPTKHSLIIDVFDTVPHPGWESAHQNVEVKEKWDPGGGLMLGDGGDDRNVNLGVACVPQGIETPTPWMNDS
jgi:hypothetical protein